MPKPTVQVNKEKAIEIIENIIERRGDKNTGFISDGMVLYEPEDIYEALMNGDRLLYTDPEVEGAYNALEFNERGEIMSQWVSPEGGLKVNTENLNISAPDLPDYMTREDEPEEPIEQTQAVMISDDLRNYFIRRYNITPENEESFAAEDSYGDPVVGLDNILAKLGDGRKVYMPEPQGEQAENAEVQSFKSFAFEDGQLQESDKVLRSAEFVSSQDMSPVEMIPPEKTLEDIINDNGITHAQASDGHIFNGKDAILKEMAREGSRLMLYDKGNAHAMAVQNKEGKILTTELADAVELNDRDFVRDPDRIPENTRILGFRESEILYLEDGDGKRIEDPEGIRYALNEQGKRCFLHTRKDPEFPYAIENRNGEYYMSKQLVSARDREELNPESFEKAADQNLKAEYLLDLDFYSVKYAYDENGRIYKSPNEVETALYGEDKKLTVYTEGEEAPYIIEKKNNRFYTSRERVPDVDLLDDELFTPLKEDLSLKDRLKEKLLSNWDFDLNKSEADKLIDEMKEQAGLDILGKQKFAFALDEEGKRIDDLDSLADAMKNSEKKFFIFEKNGFPPYAVQQKDGLFLKSDSRISSTNRLPESNAFEPKKSLDMDDIIKRADKSKVLAAKDALGDWKKLKKSFEMTIENINKVKNAGEPKVPATPKKPSMGFWNSIAYGFVWLFTAGRGDTEAHKRRTELYAIRKKDYEEKLASYKKKKAAWDEYEKNGEQRLKDNKEGLEKAKNKITEFTAKYNDAFDQFVEKSKDNDSVAVRSYRNHKEVFLEGVADIQKQGKITVNNVFANTWMKEAACEGLKASDPAARKAFIEYVASKSVETQLLKRADGDVINLPHEQRLVEDLNSGKAYQALEKDEDLKKLLDDMGDDTLTPYQVYDKYLDVTAKKAWAKEGYNARYNEVKKSMIAGFGERTVDESVIDDLYRLNELNKQIKRDEGYAVPTDEKSAKEQKDAGRRFVSGLYRNVPEAEKQKLRPAVEALKGQGPMKLDDMLNAVIQKDKEMKLQAQGDQVQQQGPHA